MKVPQQRRSPSNKTVLYVDRTVRKKTGIMVESVIRDFECVKHFRPADFPEALGHLPFPRELSELVAWSDAFVERLGVMALAIQQVRSFWVSSNAMSILTANHRTLFIRMRLLARANKKNDDLNDRIKELQTKPHDLVDENHKLRGNNAASSTAATSSLRVNTSGSTSRSSLSRIPLPSSRLR